MNFKWNESFDVEFTMLRRLFAGIIIIVAIVHQVQNIALHVYHQHRQRYSAHIKS